MDAVTRTGSQSITGADASQAAAVAARKQLLLGWQLKANNSHDWISGNIFVIVGSGCLTEPSMSAINSEKNAFLRSKPYCIWNLFKNSNFAFINTLWTAVFCYLSSVEDCVLIGHFLPFICILTVGKRGLKKGSTIVVAILFYELFYNMGKWIRYFRKESWFS